jgi:hypothetical protein
MCGQSVLLWCMQQLFPVFCTGAFWPMLVVSTAASIVASQALISGVFSILRQVRTWMAVPRGWCWGDQQAAALVNSVILGHQCNTALAVDLCL